jgi:hypothetical protein
MFNRRLFLLTSTSSLAAIASSPTVLAGPISCVLSSSITKIETSELQKYKIKVGDSFLLRSESGTRKMKLVEVEKALSCNKLEQFTLVFSGPNYLEEGLYTSTHLKSFQSSLMRLEPSNSRKNHYISAVNLLV